MKYTAILILLLWIITACEKVESPVGEKSSVVKGKILISGREEITIIKDNPFDFGNDYIVLGKSLIDSTGAFSIKFELNEPEMVILKIGEKTLTWNMYVYPGDELKVEYDNSNPDDVKIKFNGKAAMSNYYAIQVESQFPKDDEYYRQLVNPDVNEFLKWVDNRKQQMELFLKNFFFKDSIPEKVRFYEKSRINFEIANLKNEWALRNYYYIPDVWEKNIIPGNYYSFMNSLKIDEPYLNIFLDKYLDALIWQWHIEQVRKGDTPTVQISEIAKFEIAKTRFTKGTRDIAMSLCLNQLLTYSFDERLVPVIVKLMNDYKENVNNKEYYKPIQAQYQRRFSLLKGNPAPNFSLPNPYNAPINLSEYKGKIVYLYFWGTMFEPSIDNFKIIDELILKFPENSGYAFVSVAMEENNFNNWKKMVVEKPLPGYHLYMEGQFVNKYARDYMINSLPYAVLIDKEGKIRSINAPLPGSKDLNDLLMSLAK